MINRCLPKYLEEIAIYLHVFSFERLQGAQKSDVAQNPWMIIIFEHRPRARSI